MVRLDMSGEAKEAAMSDDSNKATDGASTADILKHASGSESDA
jgi:hypothetical protein